MDIVLAGLGGGVGGLIGGLLGALFARVTPERWRNGVTVALAVAFSLIGARVAVANFGSTSPSAVQAAILDDPQFGSIARAWREADPEEYAIFARDVSRASANGGPTEAAIAQVRERIVGSALPRMMYLSDREWVETSRLASMQYQELGASQPSYCAPMFFGEAFGDITPYLARDTVRREMALLEAAFRADMTGRPSVARGDGLTVSVRRALSATHTVVGDDVGMLTREQDSSGRDVAFCHAAAAFHDQIALLPEAEAAALMRGLRAPP